VGKRVGKDKEGLPPPVGSALPLVVVAVGGYVVLIVLESGPCHWWPCCRASDRYTRSSQEVIVRIDGGMGRATWNNAMLPQTRP
jgi:hypothetical protein